MKKTLLILLVLVLILSMSISVLADGTALEQTYGQALFDLGIITGSGGDIKEADLITREEMVTILVRLLEGDISFIPPTSPSFSDVPTSHWAYANIELAYSKGLTSGVGNGNFGLGEKINNNQASLFLLRSLGYDTSDIDYSNASSIIGDEYGLILGTVEAGSKELIRGQVFELLAKALNMPTMGNPETKKVDLLDYDSTAIKSFKNSMESAFAYKVIEIEPEPVKEPETQSSGDTSDFPLADPLDIDKKAYEEYLKNNPNYEDMIEITESDRVAMKAFIDKYLTVNYVNLGLSDELVGKINSYYPSYSHNGLFQYEQEFYGIYSWVSLHLSKVDDKVEMTTSVESSEGIGASGGYVTEIREYKYGNGLKVYAVLGQESYYAETADGDYEEAYKDFYVCFTVDSNEKVIETIGNTAYGAGYHK